MWNKAKIAEKIYAASERYEHLNHQQLDQIQFALERMDDEEAFDALFSILASPSKYDNEIDHEYAGRLLYSVRPKCTMKPTDAICALTATYSLSVEQVPYYFASYFGVDSV